MSIFCTIDKSALGTVFHKIARRQLCTAFLSCQFSYNPSILTRASPRKRRFHQSCLEHIRLNTCFVGTIVVASPVEQHGSTRPYSSGRRQKFGSSPIPRLIHTSCAPKSKRITPPVSSSQAGEVLTTREELLALVDQYDRSSLTDHLPTLQPPSHKQYTPEPDIVVSDAERDTLWPPERYVWPAQGDERKAVEKLEKSLRDTDLYPEEYYKLYRSLPAPRVPYLSAYGRHQLLKRLGIVEQKDVQAMLRYLSVVDDMKAYEIPLTTSEWNMAMSFASRYVAWTSVAEVEGVLRVWKEMEHVADIRSNAATFNILFDAASKAGKFRLAEMIYQEMDRRGYPFNRFHHVSVIHYNGLRADGEGVRKAYKALVDAGEIVDTVVLNCMISSLIRAYEPQAALQVYERMKKLHESKFGTVMPTKKRKTRRKVAKILIKLAESAKVNPAKLKYAQERADIAPDYRTFRILIQYVAIDSGELHKTAELLDEMRLFNVPLHGSIFLVLFKAFARHGGVRYTQWTEPRLDRVWDAYLQAIDVSGGDMYVAKRIVFWALKAFISCSGKDRAVKAWEDIKDKWTPEAGDMEFINGILVEE